MAKQVNVNLAFTADTSQAKVQLNELKATLTSLTTNTQLERFGITDSLVKAKAAAADLKVALDSATTSTGSLDLNKFSASLQKSGKTLKSIRQELSAMGTAGNSAFLSLAQSIMNAEAPLKRTNALLVKFKENLAKTAGWQISSSVIHGFMGAIQSAYGYAQKLNSSLNEIRIVTGQTSDQMAKFAEQANKAAQKLSTTTTKYAEASLIFYQQGLDDKSVEDRVKTVIKMSQVTGDAAADVSSYMTAIWNNFDNGTASLEHYADVIAALGAATASSSEEIASGLEKFAAIADTTGLSYDYATAALATLVSNTRQSAEVVGNGLRTIFSRLQSLKLGETLDDGTDLTKYSQALKNVGVDVLDLSGNLRSADDILDDLAKKWQQLSKAQQNALAQTVGGVRQYVNLISLMDNWDDMESNLGVAKSSDGAIQKQADIYAESWEAARDRVSAAAQGIYQDLIDDEFFITFLDGIAGMLNGINSLIDSLGGLKGILPAISNLFLKLYGDQVAKGIDDATFNIERQTKSYEQQRAMIKEEAAKESAVIQKNQNTEAGKVSVANVQTQLSLQQQLQAGAKLMSEGSVQELQSRMDIVKAYQQQAEKMAEIVDKDKEHLANTRQEMVESALASGKDGVGARNALTQLEQLETASTEAQMALDSLNAQFQNGKINQDQFATGLTSIREKLIAAGFQENSEAIKAIDETLAGAKGQVEDFKNAAGDLANIKLGDALFKDVDKIAKQLGEKFGWTTEQITEFKNAVANVTASKGGLEEGLKNASSAAKEFEDRIRLAAQAVKDVGTTGQTIVKVFKGLNSVMTAVNSISSIFKALDDDSLGPWEKFSRIATSITMSVPMLISGISSLGATYKSLTIAALAATGAQSGNLIVTAASAVSNKLLDAAIKAETKGVIGQTIANWLLNASMAPVLVMTLAMVAAIAALVLVVWLIVKAFKAWEASTPEGQMKALKEEAEELKTQLDEATTAANDLKNSFDEYNSVVDQLNACTKGTVEWKEALDEVNDTVMNLISEHPELMTGGYVSRDASTGQLVISDEGWDYVLEQANQKRVIQQQLSLNNLNKQDSVIEQTQLTKLREYLSNQLFDLADLENFDFSQLMGKTKEEIMPLLYNLYKQGSWAQAYGTMDDTDFLELFEDYNFADAEWLTLLGNLVTTIETNNNLNTTQNQLMADSLTRDDSYSEEVRSLSGDVYAHAYADAYTDAETLLSDTKAWKNSTGDDVIVAQNLLRQYWGLDTTTKITWTDKGEAKFKKPGEDKETVVSKNDITSILGALNAITTFNNRMPKLDALYTNLAIGKGATDNNDAQAWKAAAQYWSGGQGRSGAMFISQADVNALRDDMIEEGYNDLTSYAEYLFNYEELKELYGEDYAKEFIQNFVDTFADNGYWDIINEGITSSLYDSVKTAFNGLSTDNLSLNLKTQLAEILNQSFDLGGSSALTATKQIFDATGGDVEKTAKAIELFNNLDWNSITESGLEASLKAIGIEVDLDTAAFNALVAAMQAAQDAVLQLTSTYKTQSDIIMKLKDGDTISAEDYTSLEEPYKQYFTMMMDGSYKLTGGAEALQKALSDDYITRFINSANNIAADNAGLEQYFTNKGIKDGDSLLNWESLAELQVEAEPNKDDTEKRLSIMKELGSLSGVSTGQMEEWLALSEYTPEQMKAISEAYNAIDFTNIESSIESTINNNKDNIQALNEAIVVTASDLADLNSRLSLIQLKEGLDDTQILALKAEGLLALGRAYASCADEIEAYATAVKNGDALGQKTALANLENAIGLEEVAAKYGTTVKAMEAYQATHKKADNKDYSPEEAAKEIAKLQAKNLFAKNKEDIQEFKGKALDDILGDADMLDSLDKYTTAFQHLTGITNLSYSQSSGLLTALLGSASPEEFITTMKAIQGLENVDTSWVADFWTDWTTGPQLTADDIKTNAISVATEQLNIFKEHYESLSDIDVSELPEKGTQAWVEMSNAISAAGKSITEFENASSKEKAKILKDTKDILLNKQIEQQNAIQSAYTARYSDFATHSTFDKDYYASLLVSNETKAADYLKYLESINAEEELRIQKNNTQNELLEQYTKIYDTAFDKVSKKAKAAKEDADDVKTLAEQLEAAVHTGELSAEMKARMSETDIAAWNNAATAAERGAIAAKTWSQYATDMNTAAETTTNVYNDLAKKMTFKWGRQTYFQDYDKDWVLNRIVDKNQLTDAEGGMLSQAWDNLVENGFDFSSATNQQVVDALMTEAKAMGQEITINAAQAADAAASQIEGIYRGLADNNINAAKAAADAWKQAFTDIATARKTLLEGESLVNSLAGDPEKLLRLFNNSTYAGSGKDINDFVSDIISGNISASTLTLPTFDWDTYKGQFGLDLTSKLSNRSFGSTSYVDQADAILRDRNAVAHLNGRESYNALTDEKEKTAVDKTVMDYYTKIFKAIGKTDEQASQLAKGILNGTESYSTLTTAITQLQTSVEGVNKLLEIQAARDSGTAAGTAVNKGDKTFSAAVSDMTALYGAGTEKEREAIMSLWNSTSADAFNTSAGVASAFNSLPETLKTNGDAILHYIELLQATDAAVGDVIDQINNENNGLTNEQKQKALIALGETYSECAEEVKAYKEALDSEDTTDDATAKADLEKSIRLAQLADKYKLTSEAITAYQKANETAVKQEAETSKITEEEAAAKLGAQAKALKDLQKTDFSVFKNKDLFDIEIDSNLTNSLDAMHVALNTYFTDVELTREQSLSLAQALSGSQDAFITLAKGYNITEAAAKNFYEAMNKAKEAADPSNYTLTAESLKTLDDNLAAGLITAEQYSNILDTILNKSGGSTLEKIAALNALLADGVSEMTAEQAQQQFANLVNNGDYVTTKDKIQAYDDTWDVEWTDSSGKSHKFDDTWRRAQRRDLVANSTDLSYAEAKQYLLTDFAQYSAAALSRGDITQAAYEEEMTGYRRALLQVLQSTNDLTDANKILELQTLRANDPDNAYAYNEALEENIVNSKELTAQQKISHLEQMLVDDKDVGNAREYRRQMAAIYSESDQWSDTEKIAKIKDLITLDPTGAQEYNKYLLNIIQNSSQFTDTEKIAKLNDMFSAGQLSVREYSNAITQLTDSSTTLKFKDLTSVVTNLKNQLNAGKITQKEYNDTVAQMIFNDDTLSTMQKVQTLVDNLGIDQLEAFSSQIIEIIANDSNMTTAQKIQYINSLIAQGLSLGQSYGSIIASLINSDDNMSAAEGFAKLSAEKSSDANWNSIASDFFMELNANNFESVAEVVGLFQQLPISVQTSAEAINKLNLLFEGMASQVTTLGQLQTHISELSQLNNGTVDYAVYADGLISLGQQYANCADEINRYNSALRTGDAEQINAAASALELSILVGELGSTYGFEAEEIESYAEELGKLETFQKANSRGLAQAAKDQLRYNRAVASAKDGLKTWKNELKKIEKPIQLSSETAEAMSQAYGDLLDLDPKTFSKSFLSSVDNLDLFEKALEGSEEAYQSLLSKARTEIETTFRINDSDWQSKIAAMQSELANIPPGVDVYADLEASGFLSACEAIINAAGMTAQQATDYLASMGIDATVEEKPVESEEVLATGIVATPTTTPVTFQAPVTPDGATWTTTGVTASVPSVSYSAGEEVKATKKTTATALKVTSANKSSGGSIKSGNSGGGGGGRGGGGGGRREARRANHTTMKPKRYHKIDNHIDNLTDAYERLNKQEDRAWGKDRINAMKQVSENLKQQVQALRDKRAEAEKYLAQDKAEAEKYGFKFDKTTGDVANYEDVLLGKKAEYNAAIDAYNAMSAEQQEALDKEWKNRKNSDGEYYSDYLDYLDQMYISGPQEALETYEDTMETWEQLGLDIAEKLDELYDTMVEAITYRMEFGMEITEEQLKLIEHRLKKIEDNAYKTAEAIVAEAEKMGLHRQNYDLAYQQVNDLLKFHNPNWSVEDWMNGKISNEQLLEAGFTQQEIDAMKTSVETMMESVEGMTESMTSSYEKMTEAFDEFNEDLERYSSAIEHAQSVTSSYKNILDLTGRSATGFTAELMRSFNANIVSQAKAGLDASKIMQASAEQQYQTALAKFQEAQTLFEEGSPEWLAAQKAFEAAEDNLHEATENFMAMWEAALQSVVDAYTSNMETAIEDISKKMAGGLAGGLEALETRYTRLKTLNENYVDDYEKIYQLTKITRDLDDQIDNTSNVRAQKELLKFQKEINNILQSDKKLSEYDLDYLQKKYDLKLAEIALEDAQNAKSQVTMRRDSEGNYNYVYTADENAVAEAEAEYATKLYEMQKANDEYITELESSLLSLEQEMLNAMLELDPSQFASREEYMAALKEIQDFYMEQMSIYNEQLNNVISNNQSLWDNDMKWFNEHYGYKIADAKTFVTEWNETMLAQASGFATAQDFFETFETGLSEASSAAVTAYDNFRKDMDAINATAGHPTETFAQSVTTDLNTITNAAQQASKDMDAAVEAINNAIGSIGEKITQTAKIYKEQLSSMGQDTEKLALAVISLLSASGAEMTVTWTQGQAPKIQDAKEDAEQDSHKDGVTPPVTLDTGGYTGSWGTEGRLALLHQKELVLNATDTSNILASVGALRQIANVIDLNALSSAGGFISLMSSSIHDKREPLQQEVRIEAHFPNATDKNQIEEAFGNLVNLAAQYANR